MSDSREEAEWLIRLSRAIEESGNGVAPELVAATELNGLGFLQHLACMKIFVAFQPNETKKKPRDEDDDDWDEDYREWSDQELAKVAHSKTEARNELVSRAKKVGIPLHVIEECETWSLLVDEMQTKAKGKKKPARLIYVIVSVKGGGNRYLTEMAGWTKDITEAKVLRDYHKAVEYAEGFSPLPGWGKPKAIEVDPKDLEEEDEDRS